MTIELTKTDILWTSLILLCILQVYQWWVIYKLKLYIQKIDIIVVEMYAKVLYLIGKFQTQEKPEKTILND